MHYRQLEANANLGGTKPLLLTEELERHGYVVAAHDHANASSCHAVPAPQEFPHLLS
jgi:hypothetical protein